ncbi:MAG: hypothetical protein LBB10_03275 [Bifidobacteriaceae bacterium]|jgi:hypothetical protein|nr:hypothetical protein [Bifidobacteriaceae bacterium]
MKFIDGNLDDFLTYENILKSYLNVKKGKSKNEEVKVFETNKDKNIKRIMERLKSSHFEMLPFIEFKVYEPKVRIIKAPQFEDRVIQDFFCKNFLREPIGKRLIYDNAACRPKKGTHFAIKRVRSFMHEIYEKEGIDCWILKCDINKYFYSIDCEKLKSMILPYVKDKRVEQFLRIIIDAGKDEFGLGLPLGNQTSQWFAVYYLDPLDRFIKEVLKIKYYSRYMDDFILIHKNKKHLQYCAKQIENFLKDYSLQLNEKTALFPLRHGVDYLGFHTYINANGKIIMKIRKNSIKNIKRKMRRKNKVIEELLELGHIEEAVEIRDSQLRSLTAWVGHAKHGNTYNLVESMLDLGEITQKEIENSKLFHRRQNLDNSEK